MTAVSAYQALEDRFRRLSLLDEAEAILGWDRNTMMPAKAGEGRAEVMAELGAIQHRLLTDGATADLLAEAESSTTALDPWQRANLTEMRRAHVHATALPEDLVTAITRATARSEMAWREARRSAQVDSFLPLQEEVLRLTREAATLKGEALGLAPYDALLDQFDPGLRWTHIEPLFTDLEAFLLEAVPQALERQQSRPLPALPEGPFPVADQERLAHAVLTALGFDFQAGRLDTSAHPFCGGNVDDARITTRYDEQDPRSALMGVIHETGHAQYERGLPTQWRYQPVGGARGMTLHESQSLLFEMQAARSRAFAGWLAPKMASLLGGDWDAQALYAHNTRVQPSYIRVDADEVTYPAHILLRTKLERGLISGDVSVQDLPGAWNEELHRLLGLRAPPPAMGFLQDIHWPDGAFGYFPTYTLGALAAAQFFKAAEAQTQGAVTEGLARGDVTPLLDWVRTHVHALASSQDTNGILTAATGASLGTEAFKAHIRARYLGEGEQDD